VPVYTGSSRRNFMTRQVPLDRMDLRILQLMQDEFPLIPHVWDSVGTRLGITAREALERVKRLRDAGFIRIIAPVLESARVTTRASTLVGVSVPAGQLRDVAAIISAYPGVSHNYERRHEFNLWFTLSAPDSEALETILREIQEKTGLIADAFLDLPIKRKFKIDVRYTLDARGGRHHGCN
jgi:DNA-binding Lrp family transcriptional regulator